MKYPELTENRIDQSISRLATIPYGDCAPVNISAWHVGGEPVSLEVAMEAPHVPFAVGESWGPLWDTTWFCIEGHIPREWTGREVVLIVRLHDSGREGFSSEALVYHQKNLICSLNVNRCEIPLHSFCRAGESFCVRIEAAANVASGDGAVPSPGRHPRFRLAQAELCCPDREARALWYDLQVCREAMHVLPKNEPRRAELRKALNESLHEAEAGHLQAAREKLAPVMRKRNSDTTHQLTAIGHCHIDTAWLWPLRESIRKCARSFVSALNYMEDYPEYIFGCSQAQQYHWMQQRYPELFERIKSKVRDGQWEPIGSMWVEMDCNLAGGESLVRQIVKGKRYFKEELGYETRDAWIPDVFGYSAALPQIFKKSGIDAFVTQKISWNQTNSFPHHTFEWEGIDGSRIFTHFPPADTYNSEMDVESLVYTANNFKEHGILDRSLYVYGFGDGGGGPTIEMLERMRRLENFEGIPPIRPGRVKEFLAEAAADAENLPVWVGELYLELHRGTYTTQARTKRNNRKCEILLRDTEYLDAISHWLIPGREEKAADPEHAVYDMSPVGASSHASALDRAWKLVLLNQFHDIIPGSSITWVYEDAEKDYACVRELCQSVLAPCQSGLDALLDTSTFSRPLRIANSLSFNRAEVVSFPDGHLQWVQAPPCGQIVVEKHTTFPPELTPVQVQTSDQGFVLSNGLLRAAFSMQGLLTGLWDQEAQREILPQGQHGNLLQLHPDHPNAWDAWDVDVFYKERCEDLVACENIEVVEQHPLQARIRLTRSFGASSLTQDIVMRAGSRRIDFETQVDWQEDHQFLKVAFPVDILSPKATYEIQYGHVERPTHVNTSWDQARFEVCAHKWADLSESGYGVALMNDCKYGYDIQGNIMRLSLLRAPTAPDPTADRGKHHFTYALFPHRGTPQDSGVITEALQLNIPLRANEISCHPGSIPSEHSWFTLDTPGILIETVKLAEDGNDMVVRLYESRGARGRARLHTALPVSTCRLTDLLEHAQEELPIQDGSVLLDFTPFEIKTLRFTSASK
ncbi:alpha-mannosidase [Kiritimatiellaeota bacterium B1221]|nr:alpha-mannosidase [Kiritimatiellaeota bacterium B1221]